MTAAVAGYLERLQAEASRQHIDRVGDFVLQLLIRDSGEKKLVVQEWVSGKLQFILQLPGFNNWLPRHPGKGEVAAVVTRLQNRQVDTLIPHVLGLLLTPAVAGEASQEGSMDEAVQVISPSAAPEDHEYVTPEDAKGWMELVRPVANANSFRLDLFRGERESRYKVARWPENGWHEGTITLEEMHAIRTMLAEHGQNIYRYVELLQVLVVALQI